MSHYKLIILIALIVTGITLQQTGLVDLKQLLSLARTYVDHWWLAILLIVIQTILFTFATAGSSMVWISAALYPPAISTLIITAGTTLGGITAYFFSERLSEEWVHKVENSHIYKLLQKEGNFYTMFALRLMPGFPHSVINYSSGILNLRLANFIPATITGTAIKTYVYSVLIYNATTPGTISGSIEISAVWPLLLLSVLILAVVIIKYYRNNQ